MKIAVWRTAHEIADTVAETVYEGLEGSRIFSTGHVSAGLEWADIHIGYGILRGMAEVFHQCGRIQKPIFIIDRGYWKPDHYDGYYRISLGGTQQTTGLDKLEPDYARWEQLGLEILPEVVRQGPTLVCPPTEQVCSFFNQLLMPWLIKGCEENSIIREKGGELLPLQTDLDGCSMVKTFNSSVGWEALRQGIPCESDSCFSFVGAYKKYFDHVNFVDVDSRRRMFAVQAGLQLTLNEIRSGSLWPLLQTLLKSSLVTTAAKPLPQMSSRQA